MAPRHFAHWPPGLPHSLPAPRTTLHALLADAASRHPGKPLAHFFGRTLSYGEAAEAVERLAGHLQHACRVRPGDRVLVDLQNSPQFVIAACAVLRAGAVLVPVSPMNVGAELGHYIEDAETRVAIVGQETWPQFAPLLGRSRLLRVVVAAYSDCIDPATDLAPPESVAAPAARIDAGGVVSWADALAAGRRAEPSTASPDDLCMLLYTSGSTGKPKGCMHTHATVMHNVHGAVAWEGIGADAVALSTAPMFHVTGLVHSLFATLHAGGAMVPLPRWDPHVAARLVERHRCTHWANVPTMVVDILSHPQALKHDVSSLRCIFGGGSSMPEAIAQKFFDTCGIRYMEGYGMTETISQTHSNPAQRTKQQCLGIPVFDTESHVIDPETLAILPPGEAGEIVVRGPQLLKGYWQQEDAFRDSWCEVEGKPFFRTGDLGRMDEDGYFFIADRLKRMINAAGFKVWPAEVEGVMYRHPAIHECCIIASPDERRGETVKAVVVLKPGATATADEILEWARTEMAAYKAPRKLEFSAGLPRTSSGKLMWRALQDLEFAPSKT